MSNLFELVLVQHGVNKLPIPLEEAQRTTKLRKRPVELILVTFDFRAATLGSWLLIFAV
ncbi:hypothetical protein G7B40_006315 [Aetokthonos hydrillicola Thurmond2011]|jgi:hypothetical protein|uniref:Uncharacterized protein n=1 Tax=Aetokthonos hydrillicola Thurmond2011 TaxID=2712845 RepID=A0AAP5M3U9_9CYAN|nr:hypothetical protein [Aetokthonos hydrillicola CCALA 1050]MDR9894186.1 hypothetical protein [Aetokthonos hydrillicola Thurmond2011]